MFNNLTKLNKYNFLKSSKNNKLNTILVTGLYNKYVSRKLHQKESCDLELAAVSHIMALKGAWPEDERNSFIRDMKIIPNFVTENEEEKILEEIEPYLKRLRYEFDHWDDAIHGFRETERKHWYPHNKIILNRIRDIAFNGEIMPYIHILDLDEKGVIKPHVDSTRFCGTTIAGVSLLTDSVMRLIRTDEKKYVQKKVEQDAATDTTDSSDDSYRNQPNISIENNFYADILLKRRSLYIMSDSARYNFTHEILSNDNSKFYDKIIHKKRRVSIICRNEP